MFITQHYTLHRAILYLGEFAGHENFLEKWGNHSKRQLCEENS